MKTSVESGTDYTIVFITFVCIPLVRYWLSELSKQTEIVSSEKILKDATENVKLNVLTIHCLVFCHCQPLAGRWEES